MLVDDGLLGVNQYNNHWNQPRQAAEGLPACLHRQLKDGSSDVSTCCRGYGRLALGSGKLGSAQNANNTGYIGFEICEDDLTDAVISAKTY